MQLFSEKIGDLSASASITAQAHTFDAIVKVANEKDTDSEKSIKNLAPSVLDAADE